MLYFSSHPLDETHEILPALIDLLEIVSFTQRYSISILVLEDAIRFNSPIRCVGHGMRHSTVRMAVGTALIWVTFSAMLPKPVQDKILALTTWKSYEIFLGYISQKTKDTLDHAQNADSLLLKAPGIPAWANPAWANLETKRIPRRCIVERSLEI